MEHSDSLFRLIKGMSKTEKGYFRRHALSHGKTESNYLKLFDAIGEQPQYAEQEIKNKFKGQLFVRQFSVTKNYLYHLILKSLELYRQAGNIDAQVRSLLNRADILYEKAMYQECAAMLDKTSAPAKKYEIYYAQLQILLLRRTLAVKEMNFEKIWACEAERAEVLACVNDIKNAEEIHDHAAFDYYKAVKGTKPASSSEKYSAAELLRAEQKARTFVARKRLADALIYNYGLSNKKEELYKHARKKALLYVSTSGMIRYDLYGYLVSLNAVIYSCSILGKREDQQFWITRLQEAEKFIHTKPESVYHFYLGFHVLHFNNSLGNFKESADFFRQSLKERLETHRKDLNDREFFVLYLNLAITHFGLENFREALAWLNRIKNEVKLVSDPDVMCFYRLFYLIVHFELGHYDLLPYLIKSAYRFILRMSNLSPFQKEWMKFLRTILEKEFSRTQLKNYFTEFRDRLQRVHRQELQAQTSEYFDYISWLDSKIEKKSFAEMIKSKAKG